MVETFKGRWPREICSKDSKLLVQNIYPAKPSSIIDKEVRTVHNDKAYSLLMVTQTGVATMEITVEFLKKLDTTASRSSYIPLGHKHK